MWLIVCSLDTNAISHIFNWRVKRSIGLFTVQFLEKLAIDREILKEFLRSIEKILLKFLDWWQVFSEIVQWKNRSIANFCDRCDHTMVCCLIFFGWVANDVIILWLWMVGVWFAEFAKQKKKEKNSWIPFSSGCEVFCP